MTLLGTNDLDLSGDDAGAVRDRSEPSCIIKANAATLDHETNRPRSDVTVEVNDTTIAPAPNDTADLTIAINDVNERADGLA